MATAGHCDVHRDDETASEDPYQAVKRGVDRVDESHQP